MAGKEEGGRAFPGPYQGYHGMSLRDWFAGQALSGILAGLTANPSVPPTGLHFDKALGRVDFKSAARDAYMIADQMIVERRSGE